MSKGISEIIDAIRDMAGRDQAMRREAANNPKKWSSNVDRRNTMRLKKIIDENGWLSISKVGKDISNLAWLIVQHADHDPAFQKKCFELMRALPDGDVAKSNLAYLEDRIRVNEGRPQRYGTQYFKNNDGLIEVRPIEDLNGLNVRRKKMGLGPFDA